MATKAICGLRQVGFGIDAASSERLRHRNGGKLDEGCNGDRGLRYLSLTTVSNKDRKVPQKYPRSSDARIKKSWARDATKGLRYLSLTTVSNKDCKGAKAPQKYPKRCSDTGIEKSWATDATKGLGYRSPTTVSPLYFYKWEKAANVVTMTLPELEMGPWYQEK